MFASSFFKFHNRRTNIKDIRYMKENTAPLVSVVIFVRNEVKYIGKTIESVLNQDYPSIEIHVQDGGSTDGTVDVIKEYPVKWASEPDRGQGDAGNRGFHATKGEIVIFLPGDDILLPGSIRTLADILINNPDIGFVYGDIEVIDGSDKVYSILKGQPFSLDKIFWRNIVSTQSVASRRSALAEVGGYREDILCIDWDLWIRLGVRSKSVYLPKTIAQYRSHDGSSSLNNGVFMSKSILEVADSLLADSAITSQLSFGVSRAYAGSYITASLVSLLAGYRLNAWNTYFRAIKKYPGALLTLRGLWGLVALLMGSKLYWKVRNRGRGKE
jgi:glycosyltransferase involved in cell wall biosynthesis